MPSSPLTLVFSYSLQFYLPDDAVMTKDFLKDVLAGRKMLLRKSEVKPIMVPQYDELSVKRLFPEFKKDAQFMAYFPDHYPPSRGPPREYFFNVMNTLQPDYLANIMQHASKERMSTQGEDMKNQSIEISDFWFDALKEMPYLSRKCPVNSAFSSSSFIIQRRTARRCTC